MFRRFFGAFALTMALLMTGCTGGDNQVATTTVVVTTTAPAESVITTPSESSESPSGLTGQESAAGHRKFASLDCAPGNEDDPLMKKFCAQGYRNIFPYFPEENSYEMSVCSRGISGDDVYYAMFLVYPPDGSWMLRAVRTPEGNQVWERPSVTPPDNPSASMLIESLGWACTQ